MVCGHTDCVAALVDTQVRTNVNIVTEDGYTALHIACQNSSASCIPLLINAGANVNAVTKSGHCSPWACEQNSFQCISPLINGGANGHVATFRAYCSPCSILLRYCIMYPITGRWWC